MPVTVTLFDHEVKALRELVPQVRGIAPVIAATPETDGYRRKLVNLAQAVEDILNRIDQA